MMLQLVGIVTSYLTGLLVLEITILLIPTRQFYLQTLKRRVARALKHAHQMADTSVRLDLFSSLRRWRSRHGSAR